MKNFNFAYLDTYKELTEKTLEDLLCMPDDPEISRIFEAVRYTCFSGGKRVRPFLTFECYKACSGSEDLLPAANYAAAIEMLHCSSLIHDDLPAMDDDDIRRGKPSNHIVFGEGNAILAGDGLLISAFEAIAGNNYCTAAQNMKAIKVTAVKSGLKGMIAGQFIDLDTEGKAIDRETLKKLDSLKTGALISCACLLGGIAANASKDKLDLLDKYGSSLGLAFQIRDDIIDIEGDETSAGKALRKDELSKKATYPLLYGLDRAKLMCRTLTEDAIEAAGMLGNAHSVRTLQEFAKYLLLRES